LDDSLNAAVGADDRYEWRKLDNVVVVRPKGAWDDQSNPFNRPMRNVHAEDAAPLAVLQGVRDFMSTDKFAIGYKPTRMPVSFHIQSGTVIDVLNELMVAADNVLWIASYRPIGQPADRFPTWDLDLQIRDSDHLDGLSSSHRLLGGETCLAGSVTRSLIPSVRTRLQSDSGRVCAGRQVREPIHPSSEPTV
jgi:hypothetical protein